MRDVEPILAELGFAEHYYALCERFPIDLHSDFRTLCEALTQLRRAIADAEWHVQSTTPTSHGIRAAAVTTRSSERGSRAAGG